jgi:hypothetical protein
MACGYNWWNWTPRPYRQRRGESTRGDNVAIPFLLLAACFMVPMGIILWLFLLSVWAVDLYRRRRVRAKVETRFPQPDPPGLEQRIREIEETNGGAHASKRSSADARACHDHRQVTAPLRGPSHRVIFAAMPLYSVVGPDDLPVLQKPCAATLRHFQPCLPKPTAYRYFLVVSRSARWTLALNS